MKTKEDIRVYSKQYRYYSKEKNKEERKKKVMKEFWVQLYKDIEAAGLYKQEDNSYKEQVFTILNKNKDQNNIDSWAPWKQNLQTEIENLTMNFDEKSIFKETPLLIKKMIGKEVVCAKDYLGKRLPSEIYHWCIEPLGTYTLEAIIIYVLGSLFNSIHYSSVVRVATLLDKLDKTVIIHAEDIRNKNEVSCKNGDLIKKRKKYEIGKLLVEFMIERNMISIDVHTEEGNNTVVKETGKGYQKSNAFVVCNFELSLLPLKLNLPMVCKPLNWRHISDTEYTYIDVKEELEGYTPINHSISMVKSPIMLSDMRGGYLSNPTTDIYNRFSLISVNNLTNFNIEIKEDKYLDLCKILNGLQKQGFLINKKMLDFIKNNRATLEKEGIFMPGILARVNLIEVNDLLRKSYFKNNQIKDVCNLSDLLKELAERVQTARYEDFIIKIASAYDSYVFYLPAFMDFRGRIYRAGILHFHERDLARSLILFDNNNRKRIKKSEKDVIATSAAFKYQKFTHYDDALKWYKEKESLFSASDESLISFAKDATEPFQFIAKVLGKAQCEGDMNEYDRQPITQDAAASAYQIMSYLLLNEDMARKTNLIPDRDGQIQDVYMCLLKEFKVFLHEKINDKSKLDIIESRLDRKLIKRLFMPLIYGKTMISMHNDIRVKYGPLLSPKDSSNLAKLSIEFWKEKYPDIANLMNLISIISWFCSVMDRAVVYDVPFYNTKQDYMAFDKEVINVYERISKKRRRVTLSVPTTRRDKRKTQAAACANFIHQKDAYIALKVVESLLSEDAPIYTVHDNFITTVPYVGIVPNIYSNVFINMGDPLLIINQFIYQNLISPEYRAYKSKITPNSHFGSNQGQITSDSLKELFIFIRNDKLLIKDKNKWDKKISELTKYYNIYEQTVRSKVSSDKLKESKSKWEMFKNLLVYNATRNCVHF